MLGEPEDKKLKADFDKVKKMLGMVPCEHEIVTEDDAANLANRMKKLESVEH